LQEVCLELPDGPWLLPDLPDAPGAAAGTMSQENEDAVSLYDPPLDAGMACAFVDLTAENWKQVLAQHPTASNCEFGICHDMFPTSRVSRRSLEIFGVGVDFHPLAPPRSARAGP